MALVTDTFELRFAPDLNITSMFTGRRVYRFLRIASIMGTCLLSGAGLISAIGLIETALPIFATVVPAAVRRSPNALPPQLAIVDHKIGLDRVIRERFIEAYTGNTRYSNLDWRRSKLNEDAGFITDVGTEGVIEEKPADFAVVTEPRAERVPFIPPEEIKPTAHALPSIYPATSIRHASIKAVPDAQLPDSVPMPLPKPMVRQPSIQEKPKFAYVSVSKETEEPKHEGLLRRLFRSPVSSRAAIYDISAATVYLPNGERLEAHSGIGPMRDNPASVTTKNRGATPPHVYNLRMRESLFHGVAAIRLTPADGRNPHNRDGLLAHTYMLGKSGNSNGCVVFKNYPRFLNAFKRGEFNQLIVVSSMASKSSRVASIN